MSSFFAQKLDMLQPRRDTEAMRRHPTSGSREITRLIRQRIERGGERLWRYEDFSPMPFTAVAQALSRLTREGQLERLSKGVYYRPRRTIFGKSAPNPAKLRKLASNGVFPAGIAA